MVVSLTSLSHGAGCGCKLPAAAIGPLLASLPPGAADPNVLVGFDLADDAGVYRLRDDLALVQTVDFFTPIVDDPYDFGRIAATNALSDIYAMGARPVTALNLVAFSLESLGPEPLRDILRGGADVAAAAEVAIIGGHSIDDAEPKYGMAVTGVANPDALLRHDSGRPGLPLTLTKPLGVGVLNNRHKTTGEVFPEAVAVMVRLNREAAAAALAGGVTCATDVTGFGLLGHLYKLARASGVAAVVEAAAVPYLDGAREAVAADFVPGGTRRNLAWVAPSLTADVEDDELLLLADAQTSGGLLCAGEVADYSVIGELVPAGSLGDGVVIAVR